MSIAGWRFRALIHGCTVSLGILARTHVCHADNFWWLLGGPTGGTMAAIAHDPAADILYVGAGWLHGYNKNAGGVFRSFDHGDTWTRVSADFNQVSVIATRVRALFVDSAGVVYAGLESGGVMRSVDHGDHWTIFSTGLTSPKPRSIGQAPTGETCVATDDAGVCILNPQTNQWLAINGGLSNLNTRSLAFKPGYMLVGTFGGGVFKRVGTGNWTQANNGLTSLNVNQLYCSPVTGTLYACTDGGVYSSIDDANSWQPVVGPFTGTLVNCIIETGGTLVVGTQTGNYRSTTNGQTWSIANSGFTATVSRCFGADSGGRLFCGSFEEGVYRSTDAAQSWTQINSGLIAHTVLRVLQASTGTLLAGGETNGIYRSIDDGVTWEAPRLPKRRMFAVTESPWGTLFAGNYNILPGQISDGHAFLSNDDGVTWTPLDASINAAMVSGFAFAANQDVYCTTAWNPGGVSRLPSNGSQWVHFGPSVNLPAYCLAKNQQGDMFFGTEGMGVWRYLASNQTWTNRGMSQSQQFSIGFNTQGHVFVGNDSNIKGVYKSTDNGETFSPLNSFPENYGYAVLVLPNDDIYVGTRAAGIQKSTDGGTSWQTVNDGLDTTGCFDLKLGSDGRIYAGLAGSGVARTVRPAMPGDIDLDGDVDANDVLLFINTLVGSPSNPFHTVRSDLNGDSSANGDDIRDFVTAFMNP